MRATWKGETIAQSDDTVVVEGNHYFPVASLNEEFIKPSLKTSGCPWKGTAHYYTIVVGDDENEDAAWYYPEPKSAAAEIKDRVAFWRGVDVVD